MRDLKRGATTYQYIIIFVSFAANVYMLVAILSIPLSVIQIFFSMQINYNFILLFAVLLATLIGYHVQKINRFDSIIEIDDEHTRNLQKIVDEIVATYNKKLNFNLSNVQVGYVEDDAFQAYASGSGTVICSTGLLKCSNYEQIKGILAHEVSHHAYKDTIRDSLIISSSKIVYFLSYKLCVRFEQIQNYSNNFGCIGIFVLPFFLASALITMVCSFVLKVIVFLYNIASRQTELRADLTACKAGYAKEMLAGMNAIGTLFDFDRGSINYIKALFLTHPPTIERIEQIESYIKGTKYKPKRKILEKFALVIIFGAVLFYVGDNILSNTILVRSTKNTLSKIIGPNLYRSGKFPTGIYLTDKNIERLASMNLKDISLPIYFIGKVHINGKVKEKYYFGDEIRETNIFKNIFGRNNYKILFKLPYYVPLSKGIILNFSQLKPLKINEIHKENSGYKLIGVYGGYLSLKGIEYP